VWARLRVSVAWCGSRPSDDGGSHAIHLGVGLVLCSAKDDTVVEYALSRSLSATLVAAYQTALPNRAILQDKLRELRAMTDTDVA